MGEGYCSFHHSFLHLSQMYPEVVQIATRCLKSFLKGGVGCTKGRTPDLGQLLTYLCITPAKSGDWHALAPNFLEECFHRQVRWVLKAEPSLENACSVKCRLQSTF